MTTAIKAGAIRPATRTENVRYAVRDITVLAGQVARTGRKMLYLNVGDPNLFDFAPPPHIVDAVHRAMRDNRNGYAPTSGIPAALDAIRAAAGAKGIGPIHHVFVCSGCSEAIELSLTALVNPGENVMLPSPGYPLYTAVLSKIGAVNNEYFLDEANDWQPDVDDIAAKIDARTRAIVLINPNNPTGSLYSRAVLERIVELAIEHNLVIFSDEIYDKLLFDGREHVSTAAISSEAKVITFNGLSKAYLVPGFRIGWGIVSGPEGELDDYCEAIRKLERARLCANHPEQYAIQPALQGPQDHIPEMMVRLTRRRDLMVTELNAIPGVSCVRPGGAFYAFPRIEIDATDEEFVADVIRQTGVVLVHGSGFGQRPGTRHFRVVFLPPEEILHAAFGHIRTVLNGRA